MYDRLMESAMKSLAGVLSLIVGGLVAAIFAVIGLVFLWQGLAAWLVPSLGVMGALLVAGVAGLVVALIVALLLFARARHTPRPAEPSPESERDRQALELGFMAVETVRQEVRAHPGQATLIALVTGAVLGANPDLARKFVDATKDLSGTDR